MTSLFANRAIPRWKTNSQCMFMKLVRLKAMHGSRMQRATNWRYPQPLGGSVGVVENRQATGGARPSGRTVHTRAASRKPLSRSGQLAAITLVHYNLRDRPLQGSPRSLRCWNAAHAPGVFDRALRGTSGSGQGSLRQVLSATHGQICPQLDGKVQLVTFASCT